MSKAVLENVRRHRAVASLYRQTAAFRPIQRRSLLAEAAHWEHLALSELEAYFSADPGLPFFTAVSDTGAADSRT
jgi:hypothetical protein